MPSISDIIVLVSILRILQRGCLGLLLVSRAVPVDAGQLPIRMITVADGLISDNVTALLEDRNGYLWIGTSVGLSRYDGRIIHSYNAQDGLSHPSISEIAQTPDGTIWLATAGGLDRMLEFRRKDGLLFETSALDPRSHFVSSLDVDREGNLWAASGEDVWRLRSGEKAFERIPLSFNWIEGRPRVVTVLRAAPDGSLWVGSTSGLYRLRPDGTTIPYIPDPALVSTTISVLEIDRNGMVWADINATGILVIAPAPFQSDTGMRIPGGARVALRADDRPSEPGTAVFLGPKAGIPRESITGIAFGPNGAYHLISYKQGLFSSEGESLRHFGVDEGLPEEQFKTVLAEDESNLWIGTGSSGLLRIIPGGFTNFSRKDGLKTSPVASVFPDRNGRIIVDGFPPGMFLHELKDEHFLGVRLPVPFEAGHGSWGLSQVSVQDWRGQWWIPTTQGLYRFPAVGSLRELAHARPQAVYHKENGLGGEEVFRVFADSTGGVWAGVFGQHSVLRWDNDAGRWQAFGKAEGLPETCATAFAEDTKGAVWIGFYEGGLARFVGGHFDVFQVEDGMPPGFVFVLEADDGGHLWIGTTSGGLGRTDETAAAHPQWLRYTTENGLATDSILALTADERGFLWIGSMKGLDRLNIETGVIEHLDTRDGLVANSVISSCADANGNLWFGTGKGVSRLHPGPGKDFRIPPVLIEGILVAGVPLTVPELGVEKIDTIDCPVGTGSIDLHFSAPCLGGGHRLKFRYRLGSGNWSEVLPEPRIRLAEIGPGNYRLRIRAETVDGKTGPEALVGFRIPPPVWRRWWFLAGVLCLLGAGLYFWHRNRVRRLLELQRIREHIASDLHDEFGLSLSRISILSDLVRNQVGEEAEIRQDLGKIGETARNLIDATSDMAWALDPSKDTLGSVVARIRRAAGDICEGSRVRLEVQLDPALKEISLHSETRRHLLLILKEAVHNALRHGDPDHLRLQVSRSDSKLLFIVEDDGCGFDPETISIPDKQGLGMAGMRRRAREVGGVIEVSSTPGTGTRIRLSIPLEPA